MEQYQKLVAHILKNGDKKSDRTGTGTLSVFGYQMRFDLEKGFPLVTTKKTNLKAIISELLWFLEGSTDERRLAEIHYGDEAKNIIGKRTVWTDNANVQGVALGYRNTDVVKELGTIYGRQWRNTEQIILDDLYSGEVAEIKSIDQIANVIKQIKENPDSRRLIVSAWNVAEIEYMALPPCHCFVQFYVSNGKLSCQLYQRSADVFLGVPFNIASYALLTMMIAQVCDLEVGDFVHTFGDAHIYSNHIEQCEELLKREPYWLPTMKLDETIKHIDDFKMDSFELINYRPHPVLKGKMAV